MHDATFNQIKSHLALASAMMSALQHGKDGEFANQIVSTNKDQDLCRALTFCTFHQDTVPELLTGLYAAALREKASMQ